jgi:DNA-binding transcriptional regulator YhcF (GntR family)
MPTFAEIEPISLSDRVINALKDAFFAGELKPGDTIVERDLARQMKVGTPVVREALISLQGQGFVRRVTNTGTFVTQFTTAEVRQLLTSVWSWNFWRCSGPSAGLLRTSSRNSAARSRRWWKQVSKAIGGDSWSSITHFTGNAGRSPGMPILPRPWTG